MSAIGPIVFVIERDEVLNCSTLRTHDFLKSLFASPTIARGYFENVDIAFDGYDEDQWELFEVEPVRAFVQKLDQDFPYWLYFMNLSCSGLYAIGMCFLPPFLTDEGRAKHHPQLLMELFERRWLPALNTLGKWTGVSDVEIDLRTSRCVDYFTKGREKPPVAN